MENRILGKSCFIPFSADSDANQPRFVTKSNVITKKSLNIGVLQPQLVSRLLNSWIAYRSEGDGDSDVHDDDQHAYVGDIAAGPADPIGHA